MLQITTHQNLATFQMTNQIVLLDYVRQTYYRSSLSLSRLDLLRVKTQSQKLCFTINKLCIYDLN